MDYRNTVHMGSMVCHESISLISDPPHESKQLLRSSRPSLQDWYSSSGGMRRIICRVYDVYRTYAELYRPMIAFKDAADAEP